MDFENVEIVGKITGIGVIAISGSIREIARLRKKYGKGRWRKLKGIVKVRLPDNFLCDAEIHWYEAHGIGKREFKIKHIFME